MPDLIPSLVLTVPSAPSVSVTIPENPALNFHSVTAGVFSLNGINGKVLLSGAGSVYLTENGKTIIISGSAMAGGGGTGAVTEAQLEATGTTLNLKIEAASGWAQNQLTQTGANLIGLFNGTGVKSLNGGTGNLNLIGLGTVFVTRNGQDISISGMVSGGGGAGDITFSQLTATGLYLEGLINAQSGFSANNYATISNLFGTGSALNARIGQVSGNLTQTGVILGSQIANVDGRVTSLSGYSNDTFATKIGLESTGLSLRNDLIGGDTNLSGSLNSVSGALSARLGATGTSARSYSESISGGLQSQIAATGQTAWTHGDNNARNLSGKLTETGAILIGLISAASAGVSSINGQSGVLTLTGAGNVTVFANGQNFIISGDTGAYAGFASKIELAATGQTLDSKIVSLSGYSNNVFATKAALELTGQQSWTHGQNNATNLSGNLTNTGVILGARIDLLASDLTATGQRLTAITVTGSNVINSGDLAGLGGTLVIHSGNKIWISGAGGGGGGVSAAQLEATGQAAWTAAQNNALNLSGNLTQTGVLLGSRIDLVAANTQANATNLSGNLTQTGVLLGARIDTVVANTQANATNLSGNLTLTGQLLIARDNAISGVLTANMSPPFVSVSGENISWTIDPSKASQQIKLLATGGNTTLSFIAPYNGANGVLIVDKRFAGGSTVFVPSGSIIINGAPATGLALSTGASGYDAFSFVHDGERFYWTSSALTGAQDSSLSSLLAYSGYATGTFETRTNSSNNANNLSGQLTQTGVLLGAQIAATNANVLANATNLSGNLTVTGQRISSITVTGSNIVNSGDLVGIGGNEVILSGNKIYVSGVSDRLTQTGITLISLISAASAGVSSINGASGTMTIVGAGNVSVTTSAQTVTVSGNTGAYASFATVENLTQTGVLLGARIDTTNANVAANAFNLSGNLTATGQRLSAVSVTGSAIVNEPIFTGIGGTLVVLSGARTVLISGAGGGGGGVTASQLEATGQAAWTHGQNNALNLSGSIDAFVSLLGSQITTVQNNSTTNSTNLSGNLTQTGVLLGARIDTVTTNTQNNAINLSGSLTLTGQRLSAVTVTGSSIVNNPDFTGLYGNMVWLSGSKVYVSGNSDHLTNTGATLGSFISTTNSNVAANATNLSGNLTQTGVALGSRIDTTNANVSANATNLSGNLTQTGATLFQRDLDISGALAALIAGGGSIVKVTGSAALGTADLTGFGAVTVSVIGSVVRISGAESAGGGVTQGQLDSLSGHVDNFYVNRFAAQTITGLKTFVNSGTFSSNTGRNEIPNWTFLYVNGPDSDPTRVVIDTYNATSTFGSSLRGRRARGTSSLPSGIGEDDVLFQIATDGYISGFKTNKASLSLSASATWFTGSTPTYITFRTTSHTSPLSEERMRIYPSGEIGIGNFSGITILADNPLAIAKSGIFVQANIQNRSNLSGASSDWVATADNGTETTNYVDLGINSSTYNQSGFSAEGPNDAYLYNNGGNLVIGTQTTGKLIKFHVGGTTTDDIKTTFTTSGIDLPNGGAYMIRGRSLFQPLRIPFVTTAVTATNATLAPQFFANSFGYVTYADLRDYTGVRFVVNKVTTAGATNSAIFLRYLGHASTTASNYLPITSPEMRVPTNNTNTITVSGYLPILDAAKSGVYLALVASGGDGTLDPVFGHTAAFFM